MKIEEFHHHVSKQINGPFFCNAEAGIGARSCKNKMFGLITIPFEPATGPHHKSYGELKEKAESNGWPIEGALNEVNEKVKLQAMHLIVKHMIENGREMLSERGIIQDPSSEIRTVVQLCRGSVEKNHCIPALLESLSRSDTLSSAEEVDEGKADNTVVLLKLTDLQGRVTKLDIRNGWSEESFSEKAYEGSHIVHNFTTCAIINPPCDEKESSSCGNCREYTGKIVLADRMVEMRQPKGGPMRLLLSQGIEKIDNYIATEFDKIFTEENLEATRQATAFFASKNPDKEDRDLRKNDFVTEAMLIKGDGVLNIDNPDHQEFVIE